MTIRFSNDDKIMSALKDMSTVLVYGFRDKRDETDVLYAFFNSRAYLKTNTSILSLLMPHLDTALRGIECLHEVRTNDNVVRLPKLDIISGRESQVLALVVEGKTNIEIADSLFISLNTVKNHLKNIFRKMNVSSRAEAVAKYLVELAPQREKEHHRAHNLSDISMG